MGKRGKSKATKASTGSTTSMDSTTSTSDNTTSTGDKYGCNVCGMTFLNKTDARQHEKMCRRFPEAVSRYGGTNYVMTYRDEERLKRAAHAIMQQQDNLPVAVTASVALAILRAWFSRSVRMNRFRKSHPSFKEYVGMVLASSWQNQIYSFLGDDVYHFLIGLYGVRPGIRPGRTYWPERFFA